MASGFDVKRCDLLPGLRRSPGRGKAPAIAAVVGCCLLVSACGFYSADEITATVVDADTKLPIAGVNVIAEWVVRGGINYGGVVAYMNVMETVTDRDGRFHFSAWGPRLNFHFGTIFQEAPTLILFKPGYRLGVAANNGSVLEPSPSKMKSDSNGQTIKLERRASSVLERSDLKIFMYTELADLWTLGEWSHIPRFLCALSPDSGSAPEREILKNTYSWKALAQRGVHCNSSEADR